MTKKIKIYSIIKTIKKHEILLPSNSTDKTHIVSNLNQNTLEDNGCNSGLHYGANRRIVNTSNKGGFQMDDTPPENL